MLLTPARRKQLAPALALEPQRNQDFLNRVTAADRGAGDLRGLETGVIKSFGRCLDGLHYAGYLGVSNGVFAQAASAIKAICLLSGARTITGCLTPLASNMPNPTAVNFVSADYNRKSGIGDPSNVNKYIATGRSHSANLQNDAHLSIFKTADPASNSFGGLIGSNSTTGGSWIFDAGSTTASVDTYRVNSSSTILLQSNTVYPSLGFIGVGRATSSAAMRYYNGNQITDTLASVAPATDEINILRAANNQVSTARVSAYTIGQMTGVNFATLDSILTKFYSAIQSAIP